jgi:hypothetical protein
MNICFARLIAAQVGCKKKKVETDKKESAEKDAEQR